LFLAPYLIRVCRNGWFWFFVEHVGIELRLS
jgi:hypothetical protein